MNATGFLVFSICAFAFNGVLGLVYAYDAYVSGTGRGAFSAAFHLSCAAICLYVLLRI